MHSIITVVPATDGPNFDLTTLADVKAELDITGTTQDTALSAQITTWSKVIADYCNRVFAQQHVIETFTNSIRPQPRERLGELVLSRFPVASINSITVDTVALDATDYEFDAEQGMVWRTDGCVWRGKVAVDYVGGYDLPTDAPAALSRACIELVKVQRFMATRDRTIREVAHGDARVAYFGPQGAATGGALPPNVIDLISTFRRIPV
jgi:hypothetical protein